MGGRGRHKNTWGKLKNSIIPAPSGTNLGPVRLRGLVFARVIQDNVIKRALKTVKGLAYPVLIILPPIPSSSPVQMFDK